MLSTFQYFESKKLSLAGFSYLAAMALLCVLYFINDRPNYNFEKQPASKANYNYWITFDLANDAETLDLYQDFNQILQESDMSDVSFKFECNANSCFAGFKAESNDAKAVARRALAELRSR